MRRKSKLSGGKILTLWPYGNTDWKQYHVLRDEIKKRFPEESKVDEKTIMRWLQELCQDNQLEKREDKNRRTYYRPTPEGYARAVLHEFADSATPRATIDSAEITNFFNIEGVGGVERILEIMRQLKEGKEPWTKKKGERETEN